jgi:hypothetical protein
LEVLALAYDTHVVLGKPQDGKFMAPRFTSTQRVY